MKTCIRMIVWSAPALILSHSALAQVSGVQRAAPVTGATLQQGTVGQRQATTTQECGKPNAHGFVVPCPKPGADVPNASGTGIGSAGGIPNASGRIPGAGGQSAAPAQAGLTPAQELADKVRKEKSQDTVKAKQVGPDHFTREQQLRDITNPARGVDAPTGSAHSGANPLGGSTPTPGRTTVGRDDGRNNVSKQEQQSSQPGWLTPKPVTDRGELLRRDEQRMQQAERERKTNDYMKAQEGAPVRESGPVGRALEQGWATFQGALIGTPLEKVHPAPGATAGGPRGTPNPETAGGDGGPLPKALQGQQARKSPEEMEAERKRQVTVPPDADRRATPVVSISPEARIANTGNRTGNTTPVDGDGTTTGSSKTPQRGLEKVDGRPGFGPGPDNPTAAR